MDFVKVIKNVFKFMLLVIPLGIIFTNSNLTTSVNAVESVDNPYLTTKAGSQILSNGLADFVNLPKTSTGGGSQTTACKIGANSAQVISALKGQGQKFFEKGYNYGWLVGIVTNVDDLEGVESIVDDLQKSGTNLIVRACYGGPNGCDIAPMGAPKDVITNDAKAYAQAAINLAEKSNYPFWIVGGHNEPNLVEIRTPADEALFLKTFTDTLQDPSKYKDKTKFYDTRAKINVLAPILADPIKDTLDSSKGIISIDDYINQMEVFSANVFGGVVGYAFNLYSVDSFTKVSNFVEKRKSKAYITETGIFPTPTPISVSNKQFNQFRVDFIDQFYTNPNIAAILIFNGMLTDTYKLRANDEDQSEADKLLPNEYPLDSHKKHKLEPSTYCSVKEEDPGCKDKDGWDIYYETQILSALSAGGCSNTFVKTCSYDTDTVKTVNKAVGETTTAYFDMVDPVRSGQKFENQGISEVTKPTGRCFGGRDTYGRCPAGNEIIEVWENVLRDGVFTSNIVNTVQIDVPLLKSISSTDINGTDELSFTAYGGSLNRKRYEVDKDFTRKADATAKVSNVDGSTTQVAIPLLGSATLLYSRDFEDFSSYDRDVVRSPLDFSKPSYNNVDSASSRRIEERSVNYGLTSISDFSRVGMLKSTGVDEYTVTPTSKYQSINVISGILKNSENNDTQTTQFNSAQVVSGESIVRNTFLDSESDTVKCSEFSDVLGSELDTPVELQSSGYGTCEAVETPSGDHFFKTAGGQVVSDKVKGHYLTVSKKCYLAWCANPQKKKPLGTVLTKHYENSSVNKGKNSMFIQTGSSGSEMYFLKKITYQGSNLDSMSALLRIMRTAWEQSNRLNFNSERRVCHKEISATVNTYTKQYTVSKEQTNIKTGNNDLCSNPNNAAYIGTLRPAIKVDDNTKSFVTSSAQIPFLGTVAAINERLSKSDYSVSASTPLEECGSEGDQYFACLCKEDIESPYITKDPDPLAVFLCKNGMLTLAEIAKAKIDPKLCLEGPRTDSSNSDGVFGDSKGIQSCNVALNNPIVKNAIATASQIGKVPPGVVMSIWQAETNCSHVNNPNLINDTSLFTENNTLCKESGCDVRGPFQIKDDTFAGLITKPEFNTCRAEIGVTPGTTPIRNRWGDALCASAVKLGFDGGNVSPQSWTEVNVENAARSYLGACVDRGVQYCKNVKSNVEHYNSLFK